MAETLRELLIRKGWVTDFNADTLVRLIESYYAQQAMDEMVTENQRLGLYDSQLS